MTLWVIQPPGELVAFEPSNFARVGGVRVPPAAFAEPSRISINGAGQILAHLDDGHLWLWDGTTARTLPKDPPFLVRADSIARGARATLRQWFLGNDGKSLYVLQGSSQIERSATDSTSRLVLQATDFTQRPRELVFDLEDRPCQRPVELVAEETEPCPDPELWTEDGVMRDRFTLIQWKQASLEERSGYVTPRASPICTLHQRGSRGWTTSVLGEWDTMIELGGRRPAWVNVSVDDPCCGWSNESSDQASITSADTSLILFDEWSRFHNRDYDVSFFVSAARIAPGGERVATVLQATATAAEDLRLSPEGHADSLELASIRRSLLDLPLVEVQEIRPALRLNLRLHHVDLVGWLSDSEVLILENGRLTAIDVISKRRRESGIRVRSAHDAFVVWR